MFCVQRVKAELFKKTQLCIAFIFIFVCLKRLVDENWSVINNDVQHAAVWHWYQLVMYLERDIYRPTVFDFLTVFVNTFLRFCCWNLTLKNI